MKSFLFKVKKRLQIAVSFLFIPLFLISCAGSPPLVEQSQAKIAKRFALEYKALKYSPKFFRRGDMLIKKADRLYEMRKYEKAEKAYYYAKKYFEKAETRSRLQIIKEGGEL